MQKSMRLSEYHFPCVVLISKFLQYFEIELEEELSEVVKPSNEINNGSLSKMGFIKVGSKCVSKDEKQVGLSCENQSGADDERQAEQDDQGTMSPNEQVADETYRVGPSAGNVDEYTIFMSHFEKLMINRSDNMTCDQRNHYEFCALQN